MEKTQNIRSKFPALVTYIIAVLALAVGLVLPLTLPMAGFDFKASAMFEIGGAFQTLFSLDKPLFGDGMLLWSWPVTFVPGFTLDVGAILLLLYALVTVVAVVMIIPVCTTKKADEPAKLKSLKIASVMEVLALIVLSLHLFASMTIFGALGVWNLSAIIAFGVTLLVLILQSIIYKGGSGVIKTVLFVLSAVAVLFAMLDGASLIPGLSGVVGNINGAMHTANGLYDGVFGWPFILGIFYMPEVFSSGWANILFFFVMILLVAMVFINYFLDLAGLGKRTTRGLLICNIVRDIITFVGLVGALIMIFSLKHTFGIMFIVLSVVVIAQLIINTVRLVTFNKEPKEKKEEEKTMKTIYEAEPAQPQPQPQPQSQPQTQPQPQPQTQPAYSYTQAEALSLDNVNLFPDTKTEEAVSATATANEPYEEQLRMPLVDEMPASTTTTAEDGTVIETKNVVYKVNTIYDGPTDAFIKKLSNDEKVEFARNFLGVRQPKLQALPEYVVGGDNNKFFSSVFIYLAKIRDLVSDGLMNKFYDEVNLLH